jgi:hypothetical protein
VLCISFFITKNETKLKYILSAMPSLSFLDQYADANSKVWAATAPYWSLPNAKVLPNADIPVVASVQQRNKPRPPDVVAAQKQDLPFHKRIRLFRPAAEITGRQTVIMPTPDGNPTQSLVYSVLRCLAVGVPVKDLAASAEVIADRLFFHRIFEYFETEKVQPYPGIGKVKDAVFRHENSRDVLTLIASYYRVRIAIWTIDTGDAEFSLVEPSPLYFNPPDSKRPMIGLVSRMNFFHPVICSPILQETDIVGEREQTTLPILTPMTEV